MWKNWCFQIMVLKKTRESSLDCKETRESILKETSPEYLLEGLMLKLQSFGHLMRRACSLEKTLMLGKNKGRRRRGRRRMRWLDGISGHEFEQTGKDRQAWRAAVHGVVQNRT